MQVKLCIGRFPALLCESSNIRVFISILILWMTVGVLVVPFLGETLQRETVFPFLPSPASEVGGGRARKVNEGGGTGVGQ